MLFRLRPTPASAHPAQFRLTENPCYACSPCNAARKALDRAAGKELGEALNQLKRNMSETYKAKVRSCRVTPEPEAGCCVGLRTTSARREEFSTFLAKELVQKVSIAGTNLRKWMNFKQCIVNVFRSSGLTHKAGYDL